MSGIYKAGYAANPTYYQKRSRDWSAANPEKHRKSAKNCELKAHYGVTLEEFEAMKSAQGGKCAVCESVLKSGKRGAHLDHCHKMGTVRAVLCALCNLGIGYFKDSPTHLRAAADYLERFAH